MGGVYAAVQARGHDSGGAIMMAAEVQEVDWQKCGG